MSTIANAEEKYRDMWTRDVHRYAIVRLSPEEPDDGGILDLELDAYIVIEEDEVFRLICARLRQAGAPTLFVKDLDKK
jgi:hypothetical protein